MGRTNLLVSSAPTERMLQHPNSPTPTRRRLQPPSFYQLQLQGCYNTLIFQINLEGGHNTLAHQLQPIVLVPPSHPQQEHVPTCLLKASAPNSIKPHISNYHCLCLMSFSILSKVLKPNLPYASLNLPALYGSSWLS